MVGRLSLCWGDKNTFRKLPGESVYYTATIRDLKPTEAGIDHSCQVCVLNVFFSKMKNVCPCVQLLLHTFPMGAQKCLRFTAYYAHLVYISCTKLVRYCCPLFSTAAAMDPFSVTLYTLFMDRGNHDDLRLRDHTDLVIPELRDQIYSLPVSILIFHESSRDKVKCSLQRAYTATPISLDIAKRSSHVLHISKHLTRVMFNVPASSEKSGTYGVSCTGNYYYLPDNKWFPAQVEKAITLRFEQCKETRECTV